MQKSAALEAKC